MGAECIMGTASAIWTLKVAFFTASLRALGIEAPVAPPAAFLAGLGAVLAELLTFGVDIVLRPWGWIHGPLPAAASRRDHPGGLVRFVSRGDRLGFLGTPYVHSIALRGGAASLFWPDR